MAMLMSFMGLFVCRHPVGTKLSAAFAAWMMAHSPPLRTQTATGP